MIGLWRKAWPRSRTRHLARGSVSLAAEPCCALRREDRHEDAARGALRDRHALVKPLLRLDDDDAGKDRPEPPAGLLQHIVEPHHEAPWRRRKKQRVAPRGGREIGLAQQFR